MTHDDAAPHVGLQRIGPEVDAVQAQRAACPHWLYDLATERDGQFPRVQDGAAPACDDMVGEAVVGRDAVEMTGLGLGVVVGHPGCNRLFQTGFIPREGLRRAALIGRLLLHPVPADVAGQLRENNALDCRKRRLNDFGLCVVRKSMLDSLGIGVILALGSIIDINHNKTLQLCNVVNEVGPLVFASVIQIEP